MAGELIQIEARDEEDRARVRILDARDMPNLKEMVQVLDQVGLAPWRPALPAAIGQVMRDSAAERAGLQPGDLIIRAAGEPITDWEQWRNFIQRHPLQPLAVRIERDGVEQVLELTPDVRESERGERVGFIGAIPEVPAALAESLRVVVRYGPLEAVG
ncbi:site-2 protease family protein, partial [Arthrospira platensis SPKY1]|nr:site-2 protease family protein [Arthrospira platensis SPKY1]